MTIERDDARPRRYLTLKQAAVYLELSVWSLYRLVDRRAIPFIPLRPSGNENHLRGRASLRFDIAALDAWMKQSTVRPVLDSSHALNQSRQSS